MEESKWDNSQHFKWWVNLPLFMLYSFFNIQYFLLIATGLNFFYICIYFILAILQVRFLENQLSAKTFQGLFQVCKTFWFSVWFGIIILLIENNRKINFLSIENNTATQASSFFFFPFRLDQADLHRKACLWWPVQSNGYSYPRTWQTEVSIW